MYDTKRQGRLVTERLSDISLLEERNQTTGFIYVVKYAGQDRRFLEMENLYKIGFASNLKQRLRNTENQSTYLYAPVTLVASFEVQNVKAELVEKVLHHYFADKQVRMSTVLANGREVEAKEWFIVKLEDISDTINQLFTDLNK